jgi:hypothetical protein
MIKTYSGSEMVNIGTGADITIAEFDRVVAAIVGYTGIISFDASRAGRHATQVARRQPAGQARLARLYFAR